MKRSSLTPARAPAAVPALALSLAFSLLSPLHAQVGNNNPTGVSGIFNGQIADGVDPYTGNVRRSITDIVVSGAVGEYPLALVRTYNSRTPSLTSSFGRGGWNHNYNWILEDSPTSTTSYFHPARYTVDFPDGRVETFRAVTWDSNYRVRPGADTPAQTTSAGVRERFVQLNVSTMLAYLLLPDGGKVEFQAEQHSLNGQYYYKYTATAIVDPHGLRTTLTWQTLTGGWKRLTTVTEPAGRYLQFTYTGPNSLLISQVTEVIGGVSRRNVNYYYQAYPDLGLDHVVYYNNSNWTARYQYCGPNVQNSVINLLCTCDDPMYPGPMKRIFYVYMGGMNPDETWVVYGQISSERYWDGVPGHETWGQAVSTLTVGASNPINHNIRTETRGDNATRTFLYTTQGYVTWVSDFMGHSAGQHYNSYNYIDWVRDRNGHQTDFTSDPITGNVTQITYPLTPGDTPGQGNTRPTVNYTYTNNYYLHTSQDEGGDTTTITRDGNNRVTEIQYADWGYETFSYNSFGEVLSHRTVTAGTETFSYDGRGLEQTYRNPDNASGNPTARYRYDTLDRVTDVTDVLGTSLGDGNHTKSFSYNDRGQTLVTTLPKDPNDNVRHTITNAYNPDGTLQSRTDQLNHLTNYTYDDYRRLKSVTPPVRGFGDNSQHIAYLFYDANGTGDDYTFTDSNATYAKLPSGKKTKTVYDDNRRKSSVTVGYGTADAATTGYGYDIQGNVTSVTNPLNHNNVTTIYDERNRPSSISVGGQTTAFTYDTAGRRKTITRPNGQVITYDTFDVMNRVTQQTVTQSPDPPAVTKYTYYTIWDGGPVGLLKTMQDPRLVAMNSPYKYTYSYDNTGRKTSVQYPPDSLNQQRTEQWAYDTVGRLQTFTNRDSKIQTFTYDALNRLTGFTWNDGGTTPSVSFGYDAASRLTSVNNANANITRQYYNDNVLRLETEQITGGPGSKTVTYSYDADGNRASLQYPSNSYSFTYAYTGRNQLQSVLSGNTPLATYGYNAAGDMISRSVGLTGSSSYTYDALDRVTHIEHSLVGTTRTLDYAYDSVGNRKWTKRDGGNGDVFGYDYADEVTAVKLNIPNPDTTAPGGQTIVYDANGNRTSFAPYGSTDTYATNNLNQYTSRNNINAAYDNNANLVTGVDGSSYTYDAQNRLTSAYKSGTTETFKYDGLNRQVSRTIGTSTTYNVYDGWGLIGEYQSGTLTAAYLSGAGGLVKNLVSGNYYYQDGSGSTSHVADSTGHLLEWYRYDLQGTPIFYNAANTQIPSSNYGVRHLFTGQQWYADVGLYDLRNRFYSPDIGRFLQPDPSGFNGDPTNLYRYCHNNPVTWRDPSGLQDPQTVEGEVPMVWVFGFFLGADGPPGSILGAPPGIGFSDPSLGISGGSYFGPWSGSYYSRFGSTWRGLPFRLPEGNQPSSVPSQNPDLPDPTAALYPPGGTLTLQEANYWYMNGGGNPAVVDATCLDFSAVDPNGFDPNTGRQLYTFPKFQGITPSQDFFVYGTVTLQLTSDGTFGVLTDRYNFEMHPWIQQPGRNILTIIGNINANPNPFTHGTPYPIIFYNTVPVPYGGG